MRSKTIHQKSKRGKNAARKKKAKPNHTGTHTTEKGTAKATSNLGDTCAAAVTKVRNLAEAAFQTIQATEELRKRLSREDSIKACDSIIDKMDETLALMARNLSPYIHRRVEATSNTDLLFGIYAETLGNLERFSSVWQRCIVTEEDVASSDSPGFWLLSALTNAVRLFESECERRPLLFRHWAQEQPCLPMLVFKHRSAYRKRFTRLAEETELGKRCPINVSPGANYSLETPINNLVFEILIDFMGARDWISFARSRDPNRAWREGATIEDQLAEQGGLAKELQPVYFAACELPPLSKATAQQWTDVYVIPYLEANGTDFFAAPEFASLRKRKRVKSMATMRAEVRKDILRSLVGLARPASPKRGKGSVKQ